MMLPLHEIVNDYVAMRRKLGFRLHCYDTVLHEFVDFLHNERVHHVTTKLALQWATQRSDCSAAWRAHQLTMLRGFARYLSARDPRSEVPPLGLLKQSQNRRRPHLYTSDEVVKLMRATNGLDRGISPLWPATMATLIGLLAATGLRIGEVLRLNQSDVDWQQSVLNIHRSKFRRSRLVPLHVSTTRALQRYATLRNGAHPGSRNPSLFVSQTGKRLQYGHVHKTFLWLLAQIGLPCSRDRHGPGLHDLRHRFAVNTLVQWYRAGQDVERHMLILSTYLGHRRVVDTYWYLSAAPELMGLARARLERNLRLMP